MEMQVTPSALEEAKSTGAARFTIGDDELYLVAPRHAKSSPPEPYQDAEKLLQTPVSRAAYSDRTAWLMATLSQLAYWTFESEGGDDVDRLSKALATAGFYLVGTFDSPETGTQAFLAQRPGEYYVLAFRGTEKNRKDILTDLDARFYETPEGKAHRGFSSAYDSVSKDICEILRKRPSGDAEPLFVTGHSLGGALATVATKMLESEFIVSACYTYGSPRVGNAEWSDGLKSPVYRVVNGADGVPLVPASGFLRDFLSWFSDLSPLPILRSTFEKIAQSGFVGFQHVGDFRFLAGTPENASLKKGSAATFARWRHVVVGKLFSALKTFNPSSLSATFADHSIQIYVTKLRKIAHDRNQEE